MNLLITGGLGHIGTYVLQKAHQLKNIKKIYVIDKSEDRILSLLNLRTKKKIIFINLDISKNKIKSRQMGKIDCVLHLASITNAEESIENKKKIFRNNLGCFNNVLKFCKLKKINLVHLSSTSIYGSKELYVDENCKDIIPQSPYAKIKIIEENKLKKTNKKFKYVTLRLGTIVGASCGMRFHTAVNKFCLQAHHSEPLHIWKTAYNQYRPYLSINDSFKAFKFFIDKKIFDREIYNVVSKNLTVRSIVNIVNKSKKTKIKFVKSKIMNELSYKVTSLKLKKLGLKLNSDLKKEINKTLKILNKKAYL